MVDKSDFSRWGSTDSNLETGTLQRIPNFCQAHRIQLLPLLDDTVTELILDVVEVSEGYGSNVISILSAEEFTGNPFVQIAAKLRYTVREDPLRITHPLCDEFPSLRHINSSEFSDETEIMDGVFQVVNIHRKTPYILKVVNRPLYQSHDTEVIHARLENQGLFCGMPNVVQAAGIAVSTNLNIEHKGSTSTSA